MGTLIFEIFQIDCLSPNRALTHDLGNDVLPPYSVVTIIRGGDVPCVDGEPCTTFNFFNHFL